MSLTRPYEHIYYIGNGSTRTFSYIFDAINADFVSVSIKHTDGTITDNVNVIVDKDQAQHLIGTITFEPQDTPEIGSIIRITRKTPIEQATQYSRSTSFNSKNIETSFDLVVAMIQELQDKFTNSSLNQNIFQDEPFSIDFINPEDDGASLVIDYQTKLIKKGLYFKIESGNLHVSSDGVNWIMMPKSTEIQEFRQKQLQNPTRWELEYRIGTTWFLAGSSASAIATEALNKATEALETANDAKETAESIDGKATQALENSTEALNKSESAEQTADEAKDIAQDASDAVSAHITDTDNPHSVTKAQVGLGNVDNTSDADKPISTATQDALDLKANSSDLATVATSGSYTDLSNTPTIPTTLAELTGDVSISSPSGGEHLVYDAVAGKWKNTPSAATVSWGGIAGDINNQSDLMALFATKADVSVTYTKTEVDNLVANKANTDMGNLTSVGQNIANWSSNVTNCITEIPQDIKVELDTINIHLILKSGSKIYVPNGNNTFNVVNITSNKTAYPSVGLYFYNNTSNLFVSASASNCFSGDTAPTSPSSGMMWYDTTNNLVKRYDGSTWVSGYSLPICELYNNDGVVGLKLFNGFGYIGSTVFALPGVKGLIPNGRNEDGSLKNTEFAANNVLTTQINTSCVIGVSGSLIDGLIHGYNYKENINRNEDNDGITLNCVSVGSVTYGSGKITSFTPKTTFHALDYSESYTKTETDALLNNKSNTDLSNITATGKETIAHLAMPSNRYVNLTLGASGTSYTAPADGYFAIRRRASGTGNALEIRVSSVGYRIFANASNQLQMVTAPIQKGSTCTVGYDGTNATDTEFRFIYAEGAQ